jgi:hypothetical protein
LGSFDVVVGMDLLVAYSPMQIHWEEKWMAIPYNGKLTVLQGQPTSLPQQLLLQIDVVASEDNAPSNPALLPPELQSLLAKYSDLFKAPTSLPPSQAYDHEIPLIPGATLVFIRPYWYPPKLKDEIER